MNILDTILNTTFTLIQLKTRVRMIKSYLIKSFFGTQNQESLDQTELNWLNSLPKSFYQTFNKDNIYQILDPLEAEISKLKGLIIYLPFEADERVITQLGMFARKTFANPKLLFEIKHDPRLIAGCALSWKGIYKDYSLRAKIEERKGEILEGFKKFLR